MGDQWSIWMFEQKKNDAHFSYHRLLCYFSKNKLHFTVIKMAVIVSEGGRLGQFFTRIEYQNFETEGEMAVFVFSQLEFLFHCLTFNVIYNMIHFQVNTSVSRVRHVEFSNGFDHRPYSGGL